MRIILAGGSGMIGRKLTSSFIADHHEVIVLSRYPQRYRSLLHPDVHIETWDGGSAGGWGHIADGAEVIINMAGARIGGPNPLKYRWTSKRKMLLCESRKNAGAAISKAVQAAAKKPQVVVQFSGVDYYAKGDEPLGEDGPKGDGFLSYICSECWEPATAPVENFGVRRIIVRLGPVLDASDGALPPLVLQSRLFAGGPLGSGRQWFSWIHIADVVKGIRFLIERPGTRGVFNLTAPNPLTNREFTATIGRVLNRPSFLPTPALALKTLFGEMATTLLDGPRVVPERLMKHGFGFHFPDAASALENLVG
jgi:uncharacterized protein (TIGR01777 family)